MSNGNKKPSRKNNKLINVLDPWSRDQVSRLSQGGRVGFAVIGHGKSTLGSLKKVLSTKLSWWVDEMFAQRPHQKFNRHNVVTSLAYAFQYYGVDPTLVVEKPLDDEQKNERVSLWDRLSEEL